MVAHQRIPTWSRVFKAWTQFWIFLSVLQIWSKQRRTQLWLMLSWKTGWTPWSGVCGQPLTSVAWAQPPVQSCKTAATQRGVHLVPTQSLNWGLLNLMGVWGSTWCAPFIGLRRNLTLFSPSRGSFAFQSTGWFQKPFYTMYRSRQENSGIVIFIRKQKILLRSSVCFFTKFIISRVPGQGGKMAKSHEVSSASVASEYRFENLNQSWLAFFNFYSLYFKQYHYLHEG